MSQPPSSATAGIRRWSLRLALLLGVCVLGWDVYRATVEREAADVLLQWEVAQYVREGIDPYRVGNCIAERLQEEAGRTGQALRLYRIPAPQGHQGCCGLLAEVGGPTATYPPSTTALLTAALGWLPRSAVLPLWVALNLSCLVVIAGLLRRWTRRWGRGALTLPESLALLLGLTATHICVGNSQFSLLVVTALLAFVLADRPLIAGLWLGLALMKPTLALPMVVLPMLRRQWSVLMVAGAMHVAAGLLLCQWVGQDLWTLTREWMSLGAYFLNGMYSLHELVVALGLRGPVGSLALVAFAGACGAWLYRDRQAPPSAQFEFLCAVALLWAYHGTYDYVLLAVLVAGVLARRRLHGSFGRRDLAILVASLTLSLALPHVVVAGAAPWWRVLRWAGRCSVLALLPLTALPLRFRDQMPKAPRRRSESSMVEPLPPGVPTASGGAGP